METAKLRIWDRLGPNEPHLLLLAAVVAIFVSNLILSFAVEGGGIWGGDSRSHGYLLHLSLSITGLHLLAGAYVLVAAVIGLYIVSGWYLLSAAVAWIAFGVLVLRPKSVHWFARLAYAWLISIQLAGFGAVHWSNIGN